MPSKWFAISAALLLVSTCANAADVDPPGLGEPGVLQSISLETGREADGFVVVSGRDASQQILVTAHYDSGQVRDATRDAEFKLNPAGVIAIDDTGYASPIAEGETTLTVVFAGKKAELKMRVTNIANDLPVNFPNQVVPVFTKYNCNGGGCHGKSGGQNGFALSLLGFEPQEDFEHLVKEARGRRLFPAAPERSLLLQKAAAILPHGGGHRIEVGSPAYQVLHRWIEQGMPYGNDDDPVVTHIKVLPEEQLMGRNASQQITVVAHYNDGHTEDVTRMTQFDSNDTEMAESSMSGLVTTAELTGSVAIMARYQGHVGVFRATVPLGVEVTNLPASKNYVDDFVFAKLKALGLPPSEVCDDATYLRRVTIDIAGRLPTQQESQDFLANNDPNKREILVDRLLASSDYSEYFASKWSAILRNKRRTDIDKKATYSFHDWIRQSLNDNKPYDQFVREVLTASGEVGKNPPVAWAREVTDASAQMEDTAQLFLGLRIQCAKCHHHPFEKWSQQDYYGFQAFYSRVNRKKGYRRGEVRITHNPGKASAKNPKTGDNVPPTGLGGEPLELDEFDDPRHALVDWMAAKENPFFAKALANRYWKHFFGRGLVDPEDDMRVTNPATHPKLLNALAQDFIDNGFDLKKLVRTICTSQTYQLAADPNEWNQNDKQNYSRFYPRRLNAEVLLDGIDQVTGSSTRFTGMPTGTRAVELPDNGFTSYFLTVFGRPESSSACECERSGEANLAQSLHLLNSSEIQGKLTSNAGTASQLSKNKDLEAEAKITELYYLAFSREPSKEELAIATGHVAKHEDNKKVAYEDIVWALLNTKEFLFNH